MFARNIRISTVIVLLICNSIYSQWHWQNPILPNSYESKIKSLYFFNKEKGIAAGGGRIFMTTNGGEDWKQGNEKSEAYNEKIQFLDSLNGFIIGNDILLKTTDGGFTWNKKQLKYLAENLYLCSLHFKNQKEGIVCGFRVVYNYPIGGTSTVGVVFKTTDGGDTWQTIFNDGYASFLDMAFYNDSTGYMATVKGKILKTSNSGISWDSISSAGYNILKLSFLDSLNGLAINSSEILRTTNGGKNWEKVFTTPAYAYDVKYFSDSLALVCTYNTTIYFSTDKGKTWQQKLHLDSHQTQAFYTMFILDPQTFFIAGEYGVFAKTTNGGVSWTDNLSSYMDSFSGVSFINEKQGIAAGGKKIAITKNGGKNWVIKNIPFSNFITGCVMTDSLHMFLSAEQGRIYSSFNGGETWSEYVAGSGIYFAKICFHNEIGFAVGNGGAIYKTSDLGRNWSKLDVFTANDLSNIIWLDSLTYIISSSGNVIFKTTDAGNSWLEIKIPYSYMGSGMDRLNSQTAILAGSYQENILKTTDQGLTWSSIYAGSGISAISFCDSLNGYFCSRGEYIYRTMNGGFSWTQESTDGDVRDIQIVNPTTAFAVGLYGNILSTNNFSLLSTDNKIVSLPTNYKLYQNYPNPFNPITTIKYTIPHESKVTLTVYNTIGQKVYELVNRTQPGGIYTVNFDGRGLSSGVYFYVMNAGGFQQVKKLLLLK